MNNFNLEYYNRKYDCLFEKQIKYRKIVRDKTNKMDNMAHIYRNKPEWMHYYPI